MKIVILDAYTTTSDDLSFNELGSIGELAIYERTLKSDVIERAQGADIVMTNKVEITREIIDNLPHLKYIGLLSTGYNVVDLQAAKERNIPVTNIPAYSTDSVAQLTFALLLELAMGVGAHSHSVKRGEWAESLDFCYTLQEIIELSSKTMGIIGYGAIGKRVAEIAKAFNIKTIAYNRSPKQTDNIKLVTLEQLYKDSDIISLHCSLNDSNKGFINKESIKLMKKGVMIINTARGGLIEEADLRAALDCGYVKGYAADVLSCEPPREDNPLINAPNSYITPHIAWASKAARERLIKIASLNVKSFIKGEIINCVY